MHTYPAYCNVSHFDMNIFNRYNDSSILGFSDQNGWLQWQLALGVSFRYKSFQNSHTNPLYKLLDALPIH